MAEDFLSAMGKAVSKQWDRSMKELEQDFGADLKRVVDKVENEGFLQGAIEAADVFSPGNVTVEVLDGFNIIPEDPGLKEMISGGVNLGVGIALGAAGGPVGFAVQGAGILLAGKDLLDAADACTSPSQQAIEGRPTQPQTPRSPQDAKHAAIEAAKSAARERVLGKVAEANARAEGGYCSGGIIDAINKSHAELLKLLRELFGEDKTDKAGSEIDRILNNPNLCFEDMIFMLMRAVIKDGQAEAKQYAAELRNTNKGDRATRREGNTKLIGLLEQQSKATDPAVKDRLGRQIEQLRGDRELDLEEKMESRAEAAEKLKNALQKLSEMQQALSNILNTQHETAMSAIRNIR